MPSKTPTQARFMAAAAHGWTPDKVKAPPKEVAKEFNRADTGGAKLTQAALVKHLRNK